MPQIRIRDASNVLRTITQIRVRDASNVLRTITQIRARDASGALRTVFSAGGGGGGDAVIPFVAPTEFAVDPGDASATFQLTNAGNCVSDGEGTSPWLLSGAASDYEVRVTLTSGTFSSGDATGSWLSLGITRSWTRNRTTIGINETDATVAIRRVSDLVVVDTKSVHWYAEVS